MPTSISKHRMPAFAAALIAIGVFVLVTIIGTGTGKQQVQATATAPTPLGVYHARTPHVLSTLVVNSVQGAVSGAAPTPPSDLRPVAAAGFTAPVAAYRVYSVGQLALMQHQIARLQGALQANDRNAAKEAWRGAYGRYLRLGAVYTTGEVATLNQAIDGVPGGLVGGTASPQFTGLHRIEYGLWGTAQPSALLPYAQKLDVDVGKLRVLLPHVAITPLEYATRAHEILEDAARDLLSGTDVQWSGEGVLGTYAGFEATKEIIQTLRPLLGQREGVITAVDGELATLGKTFVSLSSSYGGRLPTNEQMTKNQAEQLDSALGGALEALAQVPGTLETEPTPQIPQIPKSDAKTDP